MKEIDLNYSNTEGFTLQQIIDVIPTSGISKKDIITILSAKKSIDTMLNKLIDSEYIIKDKIGNLVIFKTPLKVSTTINKKSKPKPKKSIKKPEVITSEISNMDELEDLEFLKKELELHTPKEITTIVHENNEESSIITPSTTEEIIVIPIDSDVIPYDNPYKFVLDFFTSTINDEISTTYFRRRDDYVVKSIYNKLKTMLPKIVEYNVDQQNTPFYRAVSVNFNEKVVKIYHIDMNRTVRGIHNVFKLTDDDISNIKKGK